MEALSEKRFKLRKNIGNFMNKRGIDMSIQTIVILVILLIVLFVITMFFTGGFKALGLKFTGFHGAALENTETSGQTVRDFILGGTWP